MSYKPIHGTNKDIYMFGLCDAIGPNTSWHLNCSVYIHGVRWYKSSTF